MKPDPAVGVTILCVCLALLAIAFVGGCVALMLAYIHHVLKALR